MSSRQSTAMGSPITAVYLGIRVEQKGHVTGVKTESDGGHRNKREMVPTYKYVLTEPCASKTLVMVVR